MYSVRSMSAIPGKDNLPREDRSVEHEEDLAVLKSRRLIVCRLCGNALTTEEEAVSIRGNYEHQRKNPYGLYFVFQTFEEALGCTIKGQPTPGDTWFPGFEWEIAVCADCEIHLGWFFSNEGSSFYGLISDKIELSEEEIE